MSRRILKPALLFILAVGLALLFVPKPPLKDGVSFSQAVYDERGKLLRLTLSADEKYRLWIPLGEMSPLLVEGTLLLEDRYFRWHPGVNPLSIVRAAWGTYVQKGRRLGASSITMQLARVRYSIDSRSIKGKLSQIIKAVQIELHYSKDDILEAYLNLVPYGLNVEGAGAASLVYFGKRVDGLSLEESLSLSVIPQSPGKRVSLSGGVPSELLDARQRLYELWVSSHPEDEDRRDFFTLPMKMRMPREMPFKAPHYVYEALSLGQKESEIETTLSLDLQSMLERVALGYVESKRERGIRNVSAILLDHGTMEVKALLGSVDFFDESIHGQVNGTFALRSPGSTIKPFIYALAIEKGLVHPMTMLKDSPTSFGAYSPQNFDSKFAGPVKVRDALIRSRNIPALQIASKIEPDGLYEFLQKAGVDHLKEESFYGLAIAMGGAELSMLELVELYAMLANEGNMKPARILRKDPNAEGTRLLSAEAAYLVMDMLKDNPRPRYFPAAWTSRGVPVHWKTGTSFSFRDAWSIGIFGQYVLAVWIGNFDGSGNPAFVGREAAGPLFFRIVDAVNARGGVHSIHSTTALNVKDVQVCAVSGQLPGPYCSRKVNTLFIPGVSPIETCTIHRNVVVETATGLRACPGRLGGDVKEEVFEFWPSDLLRIFAMAGIPRRTPPPFSPTCQENVETAGGLPPQIISPLRGVEYQARVDSIETERIPLTAVTDADSSEAFWFLDETYVGISNSSEPLFWTPRPGRYMVRVVDSLGRSDARELVVSATE